MKQIGKGAEHNVKDISAKEETEKKRAWVP